MLNQIVVGSSERDNLHLIPPYLASHVSDMDSYINSEACFNGKLLLIKVYVRCRVFADMCSWACRGLRNSYSYGGTVRVV